VEVKRKITELMRESDVFRDIAFDLFNPKADSRHRTQVDEHIKKVKKEITKSKALEQIMQIYYHKHPKQTVQKLEFNNFSAKGPVPKYAKTEVDEDTYMKMLEKEVL
jgi:hypothetical protein